MTDPDPLNDAPELKLQLDVDFRGQTWTGTVELPERALGEERHLDADGLSIDWVRRDGDPVGFQRSADPPGLRVDAPNGGSDGATIAVRFSGAIEAKSLFGFYRSPHGDDYVLTTHCEPTGARKVFPCVDRPDRKVRIRLTVRTDPGLEVVANGSVVSSREADGRREWLFEPTPPMSTYLFYLALGQFDCREASTGRVALRVLAPPGRGAAGRWAAEMSPAILGACEAYYGIPYPLGKLDLIAISEHAFGAMENWGAISFQEARLLLDRASTSFSRRDIVETISHEVAHQWFGNLVTMAWWDDIWLNESFAALMETKITEKVAPDFDPWTDFFLRTAGTAAALDGDSLRATHPVRAAVAGPEELSQIFDEISYGKGASILAMLDAYLGEPKFRAGVKAYLERFRYRNARTEDLWACLEAASGEPVSAIARPWTDRAGLPVVVARDGPTGVELTQRRFSYLGSEKESPWPIPMVLDVNGRRRRFRFDSEAVSLPESAGATVHLNPGGIGFYRVLYQGPLWERLLHSLPSRPPADRWTVVQDLSAFLSSGEIRWETFLSALKSLQLTDDRLVVEPLISTLSWLATSLPELGGLGRAARRFLELQTERVGLDLRPGEPGTAAILRDRVSFHRVLLDLEFARSLAGRYTGWETLDPNLRPAVAIAYVRSSGESGYREVLRRLQAEPTGIDARRLGRALVWSPEPRLIEEALELASSGGINRSHVIYMAHHAAINPVGRTVTWQWLTKRLDAITDTFRGSGYLPLILEGCVPLVGLDRAEAVREFFVAHPSVEGARGLAKGLERLEILTRLRARLAAEGAG